jgi:uncharacterized membrane protein YbjE (DUF340 family)
MFTVFFIMLGGILLGWLLRGRLSARLLDKSIMLAILLLLFSLGIRVGSNNTLLANLPTLGGQALLLTVAGMGGSILCAMLLSHFFFKK